MAEWLYIIMLLELCHFQDVQMNLKCCIHNTQAGFNESI